MIIGYTVDLMVLKKFYFKRNFISQKNNRCVVSLSILPQIILVHNYIAIKSGERLNLNCFTVKENSVFGGSKSLKSGLRVGRPVRKSTLTASFGHWALISNSF